MNLMLLRVIYLTASVQFENFCTHACSTHKNEFKKIITFDSLFEVSKILMISSHGNAVVECGFSLSSCINRKFAWKFSLKGKFVTVFAVMEQC